MYSPESGFWGRSVRQLVARAQVPDEQKLEAQSEALPHVWPLAQSPQEPPQSMAVSVPFLTPSLQVAVTVTLVVVRPEPTVRVCAVEGAVSVKVKEVAMPVALAPDILDHPEEAKHFDAFASPRGLKADAENHLLDRVRGKPNLEIRTGKKVVALRATASSATRVSGVACEDGSHYQGDIVLLAAGALHSPRLLQTYVETNKLAANLACYPQIGRNYKYHLLTAMLMLTWKRQTDVLRKTTVLLHDALPHSSVQPLGWLDGELLAPELPRLLPRWGADLVGQRAYGFFLQTEDGSHPDNRVVAKANGTALPCLDYDSRRLPPARAEHQRLVRLLQRQLLSIGYVGLVKPIPITGTAHACGTLVAGNDPSASVVDADGKVHGFDNLYVVDGSALPRSSRVNPALTIYAWGLRVASRLSGRNLGTGGQGHESDATRDLGHQRDMARQPQG